jgi:hypothetical protein
MKVLNFRRFDSAYISQGKKGLQRGGKMKEEVWDHFTIQPSELARTAKAIRQVCDEGADANCDSGRGGRLSRSRRGANSYAIAPGP